jgi:hypothetical protein
MRNHEPITDLAELLEPDSTPTGDMAFAPTMHVRDLLDEAPPPSGPIIVSEPGGHTQCMTPFAFPLPPASEDAPVSTKMRVGFARLRHTVRRSIDEIRELWAGTSEVAGPSNVLQRARVLWSFWEWDRTDLVRAAVIGTAVFVAVATAGGISVIASRSVGTGEVRDARTLDQHTGKAGPAIRTKAAR